MKSKKLFLFLGMMFLFVCFSSAEIMVTEFYRDDCPHCQNVASSGILDKIAEIEGVTLKTYNIFNDDGYVAYKEYHEKINMSSGVPLLIIENDDEINYLLGDTPIIENALSMITNVSGFEHKESIWEKFKCFIEDDFEDSINDGRLSAKGFIVLVLAAIIDSINPCAFGVLLFLMISLLNLGSSKRALRAGLLYTFVVFIVYFLAGLGVFSVIQTFGNIRYWIYLVVGCLVLGMGCIEFSDYIKARKGKESILRISPKIKPFIEKYSKKGTIFAIMVLGIVVALFELPCTGGVYIAIITMLSKHVSISYLYLLIYNLIFVLPLIIMTFLVYKGTSPEKLQKWNSQERKWMKLMAAIVMILLAVYLLWSPIKYLFC